MATEPKSGVFPQAKSEDRYAGARVASGSNPPHPPESFPPATRPTVPDPNALPSNIKQREEVRAKEDKEWEERHPEAYGRGTDVHRQQPGAPSQQYDKDREVTYPAISEQTRKEMEAGKKAVEVAEKSAAEAKGEGHEGIRRTVTETGETGEQAEAKRLEAERQRETWGDPPGVTRETIAGAKGSTPPPPSGTTTSPPPPPAEPKS